MRLGTDTASLTNFMLGSGKQPVAQVGDGATVCHWTDRSACTVISVSEKRIVVQEDRAIRTDSNGMSESQSYRYEPNPNGRTYTFTLRKNGRWTLQGDKAGTGPGLRIGDRSAYHDYSF